jgi:hypothetical protein
MAVGTLFWFLRQDSFEGIFSLANAAVWAWLFVDWEGRSRARLGSARDVLPLALIFLLPTLRMALIGQAWRSEGDNPKAAWAFGTAVVFAAAGGFYLWIRRRLPHDRRF